MNKGCYLMLVPCLLAACQPKANKGESSGAETESTAESTASVASEGTDAAAIAKFEFAEKDFDFGTVEEGEKVSHSYTFTNVGESSLIITNATASCGCTVPDWAREPIPPGGTGEITAVFNSQGRVGRQSKSITVQANTQPAKTVLTLTGEVKAKAK